MRCVVPAVAASRLVAQGWQSASVVNGCSQSQPLCATATSARAALVCGSSRADALHAALVLVVAGRAPVADRRLDEARRETRGLRSGGRGRARAGAMSGRSTRGGTGPPASHTASCLPPPSPMMTAARRVATGAHLAPREPWSEALAHGLDRRLAATEARQVAAHARARHLEQLHDLGVAPARGQVAFHEELAEAARGAEEGREEAGSSGRRRRRRSGAAERAARRGAARRVRLTA